MTEMHTSSVLRQVESSQADATFKRLMFTYADAGYGIQCDYAAATHDLTIASYGTTAGTSAAISIAGVRHEALTSANITADTTLAKEDSGGVFDITEGGAVVNVTLPTPVRGFRFTFMLSTAGANNATITAPGAFFYGTIVNDVTSVIPASGTVLTFAQAANAVGDNVEIIGISATQYLVRAVTSAAGGITVA